MNREEQLDFLINYLIDERNEAIEIPQDYKAKRDLLRSLMNVRIPLKISDKFLKVQDDFLTAETLAKDLTSVDMNSSAIVGIDFGSNNTCVYYNANDRGAMPLGCFIPLHNCIDNMIHSAAGVQLRDECNSMMQLQGHDEEVGKAKITNAYNLPSKYVIHTVGPAIPYGSKPSKSDCEALKNCYRSCLEIASENNLESLAFCGISTGVFNFPRDLAAKIAIDTVKEYLDSNETSLKHVIFDVFSDDSYTTYKDLLF